MPGAREALVGILGAIVLGGSLSGAEDPVELYRRGLRAFSEQRLDDAIAAFQAVLALRAQDAQAWKALGVVYAAKGDFEKSEKPFQEACRLEPKLRDACLYYGRALYLSNRFEAALEVLRRTRESDPENAQFDRIEALCLEGLGRYEESDRAFQRAVRSRGSSAPNDDPAIDYGIFLFRRGRVDEALVPLKSVVERHPEAGRAQLELGCVLLALDRIEAAAAHLERAVTLDPASSRAHLLLGKAYLRLGKPELAGEHLAQGSRTVK